MSRLSILVAHPWMGRGGSEATAMWTLQALQSDHDLTFVTASPVDWAELNGIYGTQVDPGRIRTIRSRAFPGVDGPRRLVHLQRRWFEHACLRLAPEHEVCISAYNPLWFGRPAIQLIGDFSFSEEMRRRLQAHDGIPLRHRESLLRRLYLALGDIVGPARPPLAERGDLVLANSGWTARQLGRHFHLVDPPVLHPPVTLPRPAGRTERDPLSFVCLGRITPEKEIERIVRILGKVRGVGFPVTLGLAGNLAEDEYGRQISDLAARHREWIETPGYLALGEKQAFLARHRFGIHACRIEAFGIAVAEMAAFGCVPFVPSSGGATEIVPFPELHYRDEDEAVARIVALLSDPARADEISRLLPGHVAGFSPEQFAARIRGIVLEFAEGSESTRHGTAPQNLPAAH